MSDEPKDLTPEETVLLERYHDLSLNVLALIWKQARHTGELPHTVSISAYFKDNTVGQDIRLWNGDPELIESDEHTEKAIIFTADQHEVITIAARHVAQDEIAKRTIPDYPNYFMNGKWLITYEWLQAIVEPLRSEVAYLQRQINELQRPWWKRWFT